MIWVEVVAGLAFISLLALGMVLIVSMYICDNQQCKAFQDADKVAEPGTKEYTIALLNALFNDGIWPFPYIAATIATPLALWFIRAPITILNFAIVFSVNFLVFYLIMSFFGHHYVKFIVAYVTDYIDSTCPASDSGTTIQSSNNEPPNIDDSGNNNDDDIPPLGLEVTFAPPVSVF